MKHRHTVLIVEDDYDTREGLVLLVQTEGLEAVPAANGREALDQLKSGLRPCIILLDLAMPEMDGYAFRREQLADPDLASIPVAVATVAGRTPSAEARQLGLTLYVGKPPDFPEVLQAIRHHCKSP